VEFPPEPEAKDAAEEAAAGEDVVEGEGEKTTTKDKDKL
jgi:hypothetical protein